MDEDDESIDVFYEIASPPQSQWRPDLNSRMKALLEAPIEPDQPNLGNHHTVLRVDGDEDEDDDEDGDGDDDKDEDDDYYNNLLEADLYNSAKKDKGDAFLDVLELVSKSKKMSITAIFNNVSLSGDTLLHIATSYGNAEIVELVITNFPSLISKENHKGDTAVHVAAKAGDLSVLQIINRKRKEFSSLRSTIYCGLTNRYVAWTDSSLKLKNNQGNTPLHEALINGHENLAVELVEQDGSVSFFPNVADKSAFFLAAEAGYIKCIQLMMKSGNIHQNRIGKSPIHAAILGKHIDTLDIMLKKQPRLINSRDEEGRTSLHFAAWMGYNDGVRYLIGKNSRNVIKKDKKGQLPIHLASMKGHIDVIEQLLNQRYNPHELLNGNGRNILHVAAESGQYDVVNYILKHQQELNQLINQKDHDGNTPLHLAAMRFHPKIVSALTWDGRVDLHSSNNKNLSPLDAAKYYIDGIPTFRQRLTWSTLKASGASQFSSGKILLNAGIQSEPPNINIDTDKQPSLSSSVDPKQPSTDNFKDRVNTLLLVSTLVATVTFAAGFTMPGGYNNDVGIATMIKHHMFHLFVFCDTIAMFTSIVVAVTLIWAQLGDISLIDTSLYLAVPLLGIALTMMSLAFIAGVYLTVSDLSWLANAILIMALVLLVVAAVLFFPLAFPYTSRYRFLRRITFYFICTVPFIVGNS